MDTRASTERRTTLVVGAILIVIGVLFLAGEQLAIDWAEVGWPVFVIIPGLVLFGLALAIGGRAGVGFAVPAGIVTMTGLVLAVQNATELWATWAYAWALVAPGGVGVGLFVYGVLTRQPDFVESGARTLLVGLGLFLGFAFFFESVIHVSGDQVQGLGTLFAAGLVLLGAIVIALNLVARRPGPGD